MRIGALEGGGTKMVLAVGDETGKIFEQESIPTVSPEETMPRMVDYFRGKNIEALGIATFGPIDVKKESPTYGCVLATPKLIWQGWTYPTLGYCHLRIDKPVKASSLTFRMTAPDRSKEETGDTKELGGGKANNLDRVGKQNGRVTLRIVEVDLLRKNK